VRRPVLVAVLGLAGAAVVLAQPLDRTAVRKAYDGLNAAQRAQDWPAMLSYSKELLTLAPRSMRALYTLAGAQSRNGQAAEAVATLGRLADYGVRYDLAKSEDLAPLKGRADFQAVAARMDGLLSPVGSSLPAFRLAEKDLLTESVVHDAKTGAFFVSSVHRRKVVRVDREGKAADFVREGQDGLYAAQALAADARSRSLYVSSEATPLMAGFRKEEEGRSAVFEFDLDTAKLRRRLEAPGEGARASDLTLGADGTLFAADPQSGAVYRLAPQAAAFSVLVGPGLLASAQGMALSADGAWLYVADYTQGLARVEVATGKVTFLETPANLAVTGIDGLILAGDSLVGIQNGLEPHRLVRFRLDAAGTRIVESTLLERSHPDFDEPTLGVRVGPELYYVANSQYGAFGEDGQPKADQLREPVILKRTLPWLGE